MNALYIVCSLVAMVVIWYVWGFMIQGVNSRRGFAGDWFLGGFLSVLPASCMVCLAIISALKKGLVSTVNSMFVQPVVVACKGLAHGGVGIGTIMIGFGVILMVLLPFIVLLIAAVRPHGKNG